MWSWLAGVVFLLGAAPAPQDAPEAAEPSSDYMRFDLLRYRERVEADGLITRTLEVKVLLRTANAVAEFGQIGSLYVDGYGDVQFERTTIEKPDGRTVEVKNGLIEDVNPFGLTATSIAADLRFKKLTIPGLEPGDRLSYALAVRRKPLTPSHVFGEMKLLPMVGDPVQIYELDLPRAAGIRVRLREGPGATWEDVPASSDRLVRRLSLKVQRPADPKKLTKDALQALAEPDVMFASFGSWNDVAQWWWGFSRSRLVPDGSIKAEATRLVTSKNTPREKIEALHAFAASQIRYLNVSFGLGRMQPRTPSSVLTNRYGDCKDKHALLAALATSVGIDVRPALIHSSRSHLRDDVPGPQQFDHMISVAQLGPNPADWLWLDATNPLGPPGYLMPVLRGKRALLIEPSGAGRIVETPKEPPFAFKTVVEVKGSLEADGILKGHVVWRLRSDQEVAFRAAFAASPQDRRAELVRQSLADDWKDGKVANVTLSDPMDVREAFRVEFDVERPAPAAPDKKEWSLWIPLPEFTLPKADESDGPSDEAVELGPGEFWVSADIAIPEALNAHAPLSLSLERPFAKFSSSYAVEGKRLKLSRNLIVSARSVPEAEHASYEAFRKAIDKDRDQDFSITGGLTLAPAAAAKALHKEGTAAFNRKEYAKAEELLREATEADPKVKDGFVDLGRALREEDKLDDALAAFARQIEVDPFHETAYAERAYTLIGVDHWDDAEKDLQKQIEVAPFKSWSYTKLAERRMMQERYSEAADYYSRATAIEPKGAQHWTELAWARQKEGRVDDARAALERFRALDSEDWQKIRAASLYGEIGAAVQGSELATTALPSVTKRLEALAADSFGEKDIYWVDRLAEAWKLIGTAALEAGDHAKAERYLNSAWKLVFLPEAGWALGNLREKQGRLGDAVEFWSLASSVPSATLSLPKNHRTHLEDARKRAQAPEWRPERMMPLRTVHIRGPVVADLNEDVLLLAGHDGRVERVQGISPKKPSELTRQIASLGPIRLDLAAPEDRPFKVVRRGLLACYHLTGCSLVLDLPGQADAAAAAASPFRVEKLDPANHSTLQRGQRVTVVAVMAYEFPAAMNTAFAMVGRPSLQLVVRDQSGKSLLEPKPVAIMTEQRGKATVTGSFDVPSAATRIDVFLPLSFPGGEMPSLPPSATYAVEQK
jgi:tetratricopeptide (TPR) repeat protein